VPLVTANLVPCRSEDETEPLFGSRPDTIRGITNECPAGGPGYPRVRTRIPKWGRCDLPAVRLCGEEPGFGGPALLTRIGCDYLGGVYHGDGTDLPPPAGTGACTLPSGDVQYMTEVDCELADGVFAGEGVEAPPRGACCVAGVCSDMTEAACTAAGGIYKGDGTRCTPPEPDWSYWPQEESDYVNPDGLGSHRPPLPCDVPEWEPYPVSSSPPVIDKVKLFNVPRKITFTPIGGEPEFDRVAPLTVGRAGCGYSDAELAGVEPRITAAKFQELRAKQHDFDFHPERRKWWEPTRGMVIDIVAKLRGYYRLGIDNCSPVTQAYPGYDYSTWSTEPVPQVTVNRPLPWLLTIRIPLIVKAKKFASITGDQTCLLRLRYSNRLWGFADATHLNVPLVFCGSTSGAPWDEGMRWDALLMTEWHRDAYTIDDIGRNDLQAWYTRWADGPQMYYTNRKAPGVTLRWRNNRGHVSSGDDQQSDPYGDGHAVQNRYIRVYRKSDCSFGPPTIDYCEATENNPGGFGNPVGIMGRIQYGAFFDGEIDPWTYGGGAANGWPWERPEQFVGEDYADPLVTSESFTVPWMEQNTGGNPNYHYYNITEADEAGTVIGPQPRIEVTQRAVYPGWPDGYSHALAQQIYSEIWDDRLIGEISGFGGGYLRGRREHCFWLPELTYNPFAIPNQERRPFGPVFNWADPNGPHAADARCEICYESEVIG